MRSSSAPLPPRMSSRQLWVLSIGLEGWYRGPISTVQRALALVAAILMLIPPVRPIAGMPGYIVVGAGFLLAVILLATRIKHALAKQVEG